MFVFFEVKQAANAFARHGRSFPEAPSMAAHDCIGHLVRAERTLSAAQVCRPQAAVEDLLYGTFDRLRILIEVETVPKQHRRAQDRAERVCDSPACDVGRRAVDGLVDAERALAERRAREQPERAGQDRALVREDVAEHVAAHDDVERRRVGDESHGRRVDELVVERDVGVFLADLGGDFAPDLHRCEHVGLVDRGHVPGTLSRHFERPARRCGESRSRRTPSCRSPCAGRSWSLCPLAARSKCRRSAHG